MCGPCRIATWLQIRSVLLPLRLQLQIRNSNSAYSIGDISQAYIRQVDDFPSGSRGIYLSASVASCDYRLVFIILCRQLPMACRHSSVGRIIRTDLSKRK